MTKLGAAITAAIVTILVAEFLRYRKRALPVHGWVALAALLAAEWLMFRKVEPVATYFTPIAWTCWIFLAHAAVRAITGGSRLARGPEAWGRGARELGMVALLSIPLWLIFEAYNLRLENWTYVGLPQNFVARYFGYGWAFATITPAILVTADLIESFGWFAKPAKPKKFSPTALRWMTVAGAVMLAAPLVAPLPAAAYLFALVWLGFIFLLDPVNYRLRLPSLIGDLAEGRRGRLYSLLISGWVCGWLWEFWNWWAAARWLYIFPMFQDIKIFEMPAPGYFGFPPFALECFTMYVTAAWLVGGMKPASSRQAV
ncbi:MAG: hypothetical protein ACRD6I_10840 [Candidatus Acidiferrales bacterium]